MPNTEKAVYKVFPATLDTYIRNICAMELIGYDVCFNVIKALSVDLGKPQHIIAARVYNSIAHLDRMDHIVFMFREYIASGVTEVTIHSF